MGIDPLRVWGSWYERQGVRFFPLYGITNGQCRCELGAKCKAPGKHARVKWGKAQRSIMPGPLDNMGVATDNLVVIDFDQLGADLSEFDPTFTVRTAHGVHLWYLAPAHRTIKSFAGWRPKVDIRASGGMVVAPPSRTVLGTFYEPVNDAEIRPLPAWLVSDLPERRSVNRSFGPVLTEIPATTPAMTEIIGKMLVREIDECTEFRNQNLFRLSCRFFEQAALGNLGADVLEEMVQAALRSGLDPSEVERTISSARNQI